MKNLVFSILSLFIWGCSVANEPINQQQNLHDIYVVTYIKNYKTDKLDALVKKPTLELYVKDTRFMGYGGCNNIQGSIKLSNDSISFTSTPIMTTLMICEWDSLEQAYIKALEQTTTYQYQENELYFYHGNEVVMKLKKVD